MQVREDYEIDQLVLEAGHVLVAHVQEVLVVENIVEKLELDNRQERTGIVTIRRTGQSRQVECHLVDHVHESLHLLRRIYDDRFGIVKQVRVERADFIVAVGNDRI